MAIEIEKKYHLDETRRAAIIKKLEELGATFAQETFEENYLHRGRGLKKKDAVLRLRKTDDSTLLTYKENLENDSDAKHKIEYETEVADVDAMEKILESLGYKISIVYEKRRKTWHFGKVEVVVDELPFGLYMEIEGSVDEIEKAEKSLEIEDLKIEPRGYPRLTAICGKSNGEFVEARFSKI